jgi:hypothetical protein
MSISGKGGDKPENKWSILECSGLVYYFLLDEND